MSLILFPFQVNLLTPSTANPAKFAPRFCLKLKFNCNLRARHPCCQYPLPPVEDTKVPTTDIPRGGKIKSLKIGKKTAPTSKSIQINSLREASAKSLRTQLSEHEDLAELKKDHVNE